MGERDLERLVRVVLLFLLGDFSDVVELLLQRGANPEDVLKREISSLIRIRGGILRQLVAAGGAAPKEIDQLLRDKAALGD